MERRESALDLAQVRTGHLATHLRVQILHQPFFKINSEATAVFVAAAAGMTHAEGCSPSVLLLPQHQQYHHTTLGPWCCGATHLEPRYDAEHRDADDPSAHVDVDTLDEPDCMLQQRTEPQQLTALCHRLTGLLHLDEEATRA